MGREAVNPETKATNINLAICNTVTRTVISSEHLDQLIGGLNDGLAMLKAGGAERAAASRALSADAIRNVSSRLSNTNVGYALPEEVSRRMVEVGKLGQELYDALTAAGSKTD